MRDLDSVFIGLIRSRFRQRFRLQDLERLYLQARGMEVVLARAADFIERRLTPAYPDNDGKQTPYRGHPAFVAQHATATCCRDCLAKWHGIPRGKPLSPAQRAHVLAALRRWLETQSAT
jgi:hypothetical protein